MQIMKLYKGAPLSILGITLLVAILALAGTSVSVSQEEEPDVCGGYDNEEYAFCSSYCGTFDCDSEDPTGSLEQCLYTFDRFVGLTGEAPPCEPPLAE